MKKFLTAMTSLATIATIWYFLTSFDVLENWWSLILMVVFTSVFTLVVPYFVEKGTYPLWFIPSSGVVIFISQILGEFFDLNAIWHWILIIFPVVLITEVLAHRTLNILHFADIVFDLVLTGVAAWAIVEFRDSTPLALPAFVVVLMLVTILINFNISFNLKAEEYPEENEETNDATAE